MKPIPYICSLTTLAVVSACTLKLDVNIEQDASGGLRDADVEEDGDADSGFSPVPDGSSSSDAAVVRDGGRVPPASEVTHHKACAEPLPRVLPAAAVGRTDAAGRPGFDLWRDLSCESWAVAEYPLCSPTNLVGTERWPCNGCAVGAEDAGVCTSEPSQSDCEYLTPQGHGCRTCVPTMAKARACCAGMFGAECRRWPFPQDSRRGENCARHSDCEPGLVCTGIYRGDPVCLCPSEKIEQVLDSEGCELHSDAGAP